MQEFDARDRLFHGRAWNSIFFGLKATTPFGNRVWTRVTRTEKYGIEEE